MSPNHILEVYFLSYKLLPIIQTHISHTQTPQIHYAIYVNNQTNNKTKQKEHKRVKNTVNLGPNLVKSQIDHKMSWQFNKSQTSIIKG